MGGKNYYAPGQWKFVCDLCGADNKSGDGRKTWDGFWVCSYHKEVRNPQDYLRGVKDDQHVPWSRPGGADQFVPASRTLYFSENIGLTETFFIQGNTKTQNLSDSVAIAEAFIKTINKNIVESIPIVESVSNRPTRYTAETLSIAETFINGDHPNVSESVGVTEAKSFAFTKIIIENVGMVESVLFPIATTTAIGNTAIDSIPLG